MMMYILLEVSAKKISRSVITLRSEQFIEGNELKWYRRKSCRQAPGTLRVPEDFRDVQSSPRKETNDA